MVKVVVLDSGVVGVLTNRNPKPDVVACRQWVTDLTAAGHVVVLPEVSDYEQRREHLRRNAAVALNLLDKLPQRMRYLPLDTPTLRRAAAIWALARQHGRPTAGDNSIDADVILAAQAEMLADPNTVIASNNLRHLRTLFPTVELWRNITP